MRGKGDAKSGGQGLPLGVVGRLEQYAGIDHGLLLAGELGKQRRAGKHGAQLGVDELVLALVLVLDRLRRAQRTLRPHREQLIGDGPAQRDLELLTHV